MRPARRLTVVQPPEAERANRLLLGYVNARGGRATSAALLAGERRLAAFAWTHGYIPGTVYVEADTRSPRSALGALLEAAQRQNATAVAVATVADLGPTPTLQRLMRERITRKGIVVLVLEELGA